MLSPSETTIVDLSLNANNQVTVTNISNTTTEIEATSFLSGPQGKSAYDVAVQNGFIGTQAQWLASLVGPSTQLTSQPTQTASFTAVANSFYPVDATTGNKTVTLPTSTPGQIIDIKKSDVTTNLVNITGMINGSSSTLPLRLQNQAKYFVADQSGGWNAVAGDLSLPTLDARYAAAGSAVSDATTTSKGIVQLAGDLSGYGSTAGAPLVKGIRRIFYIKDYGALSDGSTDDYNAVKAALDAANAVAGPTDVMFPTGVTMTSKPFIMNNYANIRFWGYNQKSILRIIPTSINNFSYKAIITCDTTGTNPGTDITVESMCIDGNYANITSPPAGAGGGIYMGLRTKILDCYLVGAGDFTIGTGVTAVDCYVDRVRIAGPKAANDCIGIGGFKNLEISNVIFEANCSGNALDQTSGTGLSFHHCTIKGNNSVYIEAIKGVEIDHIRSFGGGGIYVQSDLGYNPTSVTNSIDVIISSCRLWNGGSISYKVDGSSTKTSTAGGRVQIIDNNINMPTYSGIVLDGYSDSTLWGDGYIVSGNIVTNPNVANVATYNTGYSTIHTSGINIAKLQGVLISNNEVTDNRSTHQMVYGIETGQTFSPSANTEPNNVLIFGNRVSGYTTAPTNLVSPSFTTNYIALTSSPDGPMVVSGGTFAIDSGTGTDRLRLRDGTLSKTAGGFFSLNTGLALQGPLQMPWSKQTAAYTLSTSFDCIISLDASAGTLPVTLPTAFNNTGKYFILKKIDTSANAVTISTTGSETLDLFSSYTLSAPGQSVLIFSDGVNWKIGGASGTPIQISESQVTNLVSDLAGKDPYLSDVVVNAVGNLLAGVNSQVTATGTYTAPAPAASVTTPAQRFTITNRNTTAVTLSIPNPVGTVLSLTVLAGEVVTFRQVTTSGYINESGNKPLSQLDARYGQLGTTNTWSLAQTFSVSPQIPTATAGDSSANAASTGFVSTAIANAAATYDDVREYANLAAFPGTGSSGYIYIADDTGYLYRWSGSTYVMVGGGTPANLTGDVTSVGAATTLVNSPNLRNFVQIDSLPLIIALG